MGGPDARASPSQPSPNLSLPGATRLDKILPPNRT